MAEKGTSEMNKEQLLKCIVRLLSLCSKKQLRIIYRLMISFVAGENLK